MARGRVSGPNAGVMGSEWGGYRPLYAITLWWIDITFQFLFLLCLSCSFLHFHFSYRLILFCFIFLPYFFLNLLKLYYLPLLFLLLLSFLNDSLYLFHSFSFFIYSFSSFLLRLLHLSFLVFRLFISLSPYSCSPLFLCCVSFFFSFLPSSASLNPFHSFLRHCSELPIA